MTDWPPKDIRLKVLASALREISKMAERHVNSVPEPASSDLLRIVGLAHTACIFEPKDD